MSAHILFEKIDTSHPQISVFFSVALELDILFSCFKDELIFSFHDDQLHIF